MLKSSEIISMGERCFENDYTFVWLMRKCACFLLDGIIIVLDVHGLLPLWVPEMHQWDKMFGAFEFYQNACKQHCGIYINPTGEVCLALP